MPDRVIITGEPGTVWRNETGTVRYQFVCDLVRTCGACLQYHMAIGSWWPIPIHRRCRCKQRPIKVGAEAPHAFADFREVLDGLSHPQQVAAIGASNYRLLQAGVVKWDEIVTRYRVRTLKEVVAINKVSLPTMLKAGVKKGYAEAAHAAVHTPEQELVREHRATHLKQLTNAGIAQDKLVEELSRGLVSRAGITGGQPGPQTMETFAGASHAEMLGRLLAGWRPKPKPKPKPKPPEPPAVSAAEPKKEEAEDEIPF